MATCYGGFYTYEFVSVPGVLDHVVTMGLDQQPGVLDMVTGLIKDMTVTVERAGCS